MADYESAEKKTRQTGAELLVYYKRVTPGVADPMHAALKGPKVKQLTGGYVRCVLSPSYEPDRRYVAQYGVERAPALIVVHPNGTYHAHAGVMGEPQIVEFLNDSTGSGSTPTINPHIPRNPSYSWHASIESAAEEAQQSGKSIFIVLDRWPSRDRGRLEEMLSRREVYSRLADMVHCRPGSLLKSAKSSATLFGADNLPALVIAHPDGDYRTLELPMNYEAIVRFADEAREGRPGSGPVDAPDELAARRRRSTKGSGVSAAGP